MRRFMYDGNGRELNADFTDALDDSQREEVANGMQIESLSKGDRLDKIYITLATAIMGRLKADTLRKRTLSSGLMVFTVEKNALLEPGIEAARASNEDVVAHNFNDLTQAPEAVVPFGFDHTLWIAQSMLDYDFGIQHQQRALKCASSTV